MHLLLIASKDLKLITVTF